MRRIFMEIQPHLLTRTVKRAFNLFDRPSKPSKPSVGGLPGKTHPVC